MLIDEIRQIAASPFYPADMRSKLLARAEEGTFTRDEGVRGHFCAYFFPYNLKTKQVFIVHHKKAGLWLAPGGHIDKGELLFETLRREIQEELGFDYSPPAELRPFLLTMTPIENRVQPCSMHYDIWYAIPTDGSDFKVDPKEFHSTRWVSIPEAREVMTDKPNLEALDKIEQMFAEPSVV